jgi:hypothetical protein
MHLLHAARVHTSNPIRLSTLHMHDTAMWYSNVLCYIFTSAVCAQLLTYSHVQCAACRRAIQFWPHASACGSRPFARRLGTFKTQKFILFLIMLLHAYWSWLYAIFSAILHDMRDQTRSSVLGQKGYQFCLHMFLAYPPFSFLARVATTSSHSNREQMISCREHEWLIAFYERFFRKKMTHDVKRMKLKKQHPRLPWTV